MKNLSSEKRKELFEQSFSNYGQIIQKIQIKSLFDFKPPSDPKKVIDKYEDYETFNPRNSEAVKRSPQKIQIKSKDFKKISIHPVKINER